MKNLFKAFGIIVLVILIHAPIWAQNWKALKDIKFGKNEVCSSIAYGSNRFVAISRLKMFTSIDGIIWTSVDVSKIFGTGSFDGTCAVVYGNDMFVAVGLGGKMATSKDGLIWKAVANSKFGTGIISAITFGNGTFVAAGENGKIASSKDGVTWTAVDASKIFGTTGQRIDSMAFGNGKFVAFDYNGRMGVSTNGTTWTAVNLIDEIKNNVKVIAFGNNRFVLGGFHGTIATSTDGVTWTKLNVSKVLNENDSIQAIVFGNGKFIAGGDYGKLLTSKDGVTWTAMSNSPFESYQMNVVSAIGYGNRKFIATCGGYASEFKMAYLQE